jgi:hypothetical protein
MEQEVVESYTAHPHEKGIIFQLKQYHKQFWRNHKTWFLDADCKSVIRVIFDAELIHLMAKSERIDPSDDIMIQNRLASLIVQHLNPKIVPVFLLTLCVSTGCKLVKSTYLRSKNGQPTLERSCS